MTEPFTLKDHGITVAEIHRNLPPSALYEHAIRYEKDASIAENSALVRNGGRPEIQRSCSCPMISLT